MLPHLNAAWNLARHLSRNDHDAEDIAQESFLRALRFFGSFRGDNERGWLLAIVRHVAHSAHRRDRVARITAEFNDALHSASVAAEGPVRDMDRQEAGARLQSALDQLPLQFREVLVLRELEDLSYDEISRIVRVPIGTVMSRLSRARARLAHTLTATGESHHD